MSIQLIQGKVLVTGATGDTGRAAVDELLTRAAIKSGQHSCWSGTNGRRTSRKRGVEVVYGDLLDFG